HTMLKPDATREDIVKACDEARRHGFATVCVNPSWVELAARLLHGSSTLPIAVVAFPSGAATTSAKVFETREAIRKGAREIDMVANIGALKGKDYRTVLEDVAAVVGAAHPLPVKVILEMGALSLEVVMPGRFVVIVIDSCGAGALPDAAEYGDEGANTLANTARAAGGLSLPTLQSWGLGNLTSIDGCPPVAVPRASCGTMAQLSQGKDTTTGHWEMMGIVLEKGFA